MRSSASRSRKPGSFLVAGVAAALVLSPLVLATPAAMAVNVCDSTTPALNTTVSCINDGSSTITVPTGTTSVDLTVVGGGGGSAPASFYDDGGDAANVTGTAVLPTGTAYLYVVVGLGGRGSGSSGSGGGGGSAVMALDSSQALLGKLVIAGGGGGAAANGFGGDAGSAGTVTSTGNIVVSAGQPGQANGTGGSPGTGNYSSGTAGGSDDPATATVAAGGAGALVGVASYAGAGGGGYGGGGGGGGSVGSTRGRAMAGGGGGSSFVSSAVGSSSVTIQTGSGGVPASSTANDGSTGSATLTFNGPTVPDAPTNVSASAGNHQATVSFTAPGDGGSPITGYTVTSSPGGLTGTCSSSPCTVTGLTNGTAYTFTVHATNTNGDSAESTASTAVTPATVPGAPTGVSASAESHQATVSFTAPGDGGSPITGYSVTSSPGGLTGTCSSSPCTVTGLTNGTSYTFTVHATNVVGDSVESGASSAVTPVGPPGVPTGVSATPGDHQAIVSFTAPTNDGGLSITGYTVTSSPGGLTGTCSSSPCTVTGLTNGTAYTFTVHATNTNGDSAESTASTAVTPAIAPGAPTNVSVSAGDGEATVTFTAPSSNGGSAITGYTVSSYPGGLTHTCSSSPCTITGLTNGTSYTFTVHATNAVGDSVESSATSAVTPIGPPGAPTGLTVTGGNHQATVSFTAPANDGGLSITGYTVTSSPGGLTQTCSSSPCTITGLTNGTAYTFTVHATNTNGDSAESSATGSVTPATVPGVPTGVSVTGGNHQATVSFTAPSSDGGSAITGYTVSSYPGGLTQTCSSSPCTITGLTNGTAYTFTVHAINGAGDSAESTATGSVTPATVPGAPTNVSVTGGNHQATVSFNAPSSDGGSSVTGYTVTSSPGGLTHTCSSNPCTVTGLTNGTAYTFTVHATNSAGDSAESTATNPVTPAAAPDSPTGASATAGDGEATITFTAPGSDGGASVTGYTVTSSPGGLTGTCSSSPCTITGLTDGTSYTFTVHATNSAGDSAESTATTAVTPVGPPQAPGGVTPTPGDGTVVVSFPVPANNGHQITGYEVSIDDGATWQTFDATTTNGTVTGTLTGLINGTVYAVKVRATNLEGTGPASAVLDVTPRTVPGTPTGVRVTPGDKGATLSFTAPASDGGAAITAYEYSVDGGHSWHRLTTTTSGSRLTGVVSRLRNGATYAVAVRAVNAAGAGVPAATVPVTPVTPIRWFKDPLTRAQRRRLAPIPAHPKTSHGALRATRATHRTHSGGLAVPLRIVRGHQLSRRQAVELQRLFRFDSSSLSVAGRHQLRQLATSMSNVHAVTCEGYTDYHGTRHHHRVLSRHRAGTVCRALARYAGVRVHAIGYGAARPVVIGGRQLSRWKNRRVDVVITR